jgi:hypothetical protein
MEELTAAFETMHIPRFRSIDNSRVRELLHIAQSSCALLCKSKKNSFKFADGPRAPRTIVLAGCSIFDPKIAVALLAT